MKISLILLTHRATEELLVRCLDSLAAARAPQEAEVIVGYNGHWPADAGALERLSRRFAWARFAPLENAARGSARNRLVPLSHGDVLHFLDDDTAVPADFMERLRRAYESHPGAPAVGGPNVGSPEAGAFERAADFLLRSPLGAGPMRARYLGRGDARTRPSWCFMLSNLGARREIFSRHRIFFPEDCVSAEENLFLFETERRLGPAVFDPGLYVHHRRRADLASFCRQVSCNGGGRAQIARARLATLQPVVLAPAAAVLLALALALAGLWRPLGVLAFVYGAACLLESLRLAVWERDLAAALRLGWLFPAAHLSYAWGFGRGLFRPKAVLPDPVAQTADA